MFFIFKFANRILFQKIIDSFQFLSIGLENHFLIYGINEKKKKKDGNRSTWMVGIAKAFSEHGDFDFNLDFISILLEKREFVLP